MEKKILKAGIVGSGFAAAFHYDALLRVFGVQVVISGAYSATREKLLKFAGARNIKAFGSLDDLIAAVDVVHVCTPPVTHEPIVIAALKQNKQVIVEKPFTGYFGDGSEDFNGDHFSKSKGLEFSLQSIRNMLQAEKSGAGRIMYAENWIYAPAIQKGKRAPAKNGRANYLDARGGIPFRLTFPDIWDMEVLRWRFYDRQRLSSFGCSHLFKAGGRKARNGKPIRPKTITARTHAITRMKDFQNDGFLRATYQDTEDFALLHLEFEDGTIADLFASELVLGGVHNWIEVNTTNHRTICNITPNNAMQAYTPAEKYFENVYVVEKTETKQGWSSMSPDESWFTGYQHEMEAFYRSAAYGDELESDSSLAADVIATIYAGYVSAERKGAEVEIPNL